VFLFNVGGYYIVFLGLSSQARRDLLERLDAAQYRDEETVVFTIPLSLPYPLFDDNYKRLQGNFEYKGEYYALIKQKLENDTLFIVCIKDRNQKHISTTLSEYARVANDQPSSSHSAMSFLAKIFKDFTYTIEITLANTVVQTAQYQPSEGALGVILRAGTIETPPPKTFMA